MPKEFWIKAVTCSTYLVNHCPTKAERYITPQEAWSGYTQSDSHFYIFGYIAYVWIPNILWKKLDDKGEKYIFIRYSKESKAYKLYNPLTKKVTISHDIMFIEEDTWKWKEEKDDKTITIGQEEEIQNQ